MKPVKYLSLEKIVLQCLKKIGRVYSGKWQESIGISINMTKWRPQCHDPWSKTKHLLLQCALWICFVTCFTLPFYGLCWHLRTPGPSWEYLGTLQSSSPLASQTEIASQCKGCSISPSLSLFPVMEKFAATLSLQLFVLEDWQPKWENCWNYGVISLSKTGPVLS